MRARSWIVLSLCLLGCPRAGSAPPPPAIPITGSPPAQAEREPLRYPQTQRVDHVDTYHGTKVPDPYRWLEDLDSEQTRAWVAAQQEVTQKYLTDLSAREAIGKRLTELWNYERWGVPRREGPRYVIARNDGLQNQEVLYTLESLDGQPKLLLDPNALSEDGTVALSGEVFTRDGSLMAWGVSASGSDWQTWRVRDVATGKDRPDTIEWVKFGTPSWAGDGKGFFYERYDAPAGGNELEQVNDNQKVYWHRLGDPQSEDTLVYARPDQPKWGFSSKVTEDGRYLVITVNLGTDPKKNVFFQDLRARSGKGGKRKTVELLTGFKAKYTFLGNDGPRFWFLTDEDSPRGAVIEIDVRTRQRRVLVPEQVETLRSVAVVGERFVASWLVNAHAKVTVHRLDGTREREIELPGLGTVHGFTGKRGDTETFFSYQSFATPAEIHRLDMQTGKAEAYRRPKVAFDPADFQVEQVFVSSRDGTKVPMFVAHKKGIRRDGSNPTYLYGYGGFNIPLTPSFSVPDLVWMEMGGVYAMPNLRGGGEFGEEWHEAGTKLVKQNVFDDFIAAAEWLVAQKLTSPDTLAIGGRSNGGLLVGAAMTQRPDLFAAALPGVGVMDMLRFNKFTIGWAWESDYGSPEKPDEFAALLAYSPYHNLKRGTAYPATLVYTADHDDRVVPAHSYKFAAALQWAHDGQRPVLIRIDSKAGHGRGKPTAKKIEEWTDLWAFLVENLGVKVGDLG
jgi:prolyl oligopeptidase